MAARPPPTVRRPALTRSTEPRTTSDTLCRSSAAVPGLLSARVNFRVSAEAGSNGGCDILAVTAAAAPAPAVRPGRAAARCALGARPGPPAAPGAAARPLPLPLAARPGGATRAAPSAPCHAPRRPPRLPRSPALRAVPGLARGDRECGGGSTPMLPVSPGGRSPGRLLGAGCPARRGAGRTEEGPARRDRGRGKSTRPVRLSAERGGGTRATGQVGAPPLRPHCLPGRKSEDPR